MANDSVILNNRKMMENFLINRPIEKEYQLPDPTEIPFGYIYCIENIKNGKKYIGATYSVWTGSKPSAVSQLGKRASHYLYEYNSALRLEAENKTLGQRYNRPIIKAMIEEGFENFIMYPIAETTRLTHTAAEKFMIDKFNTIQNGYNIANAPSNIRVNGMNRKLRAEEKKLRSEAILCVNMNDKKLLMSDSMKLFGDYMGSSKDMIKNCNRMGRPYKGWFIFYIDPDKRAYILDNNVLGDKMLNVKRSDKSKNFYKTLYGIVTLYLRSNANKEFFPEFEILTPLEYKEKL